MLFADAVDDVVAGEVGASGLDVGASIAGSVRGMPIDEVFQGSRAGGLSYPATAAASSAAVTGDFWAAPRQTVPVGSWTGTVGVPSSPRSSRVAVGSARMGATKARTVEHLMMEQELLKSRRDLRKDAWWGVLLMDSRPGIVRRSKP